jgi:hypothetical protein
MNKWFGSYYAEWLFFFLFCPSSGILGTRKHSVSETGSVSVLRWGGETSALMAPLESTSQEVNLRNGIVNIIVVLREIWRKQMVNHGLHSGLHCFHQLMPATQGQILPDRVSIYWVFESRNIRYFGICHDMKSTVLRVVTPCNSEWA